MKKLLLILLAILSIHIGAYAQTLAFPGAEGGGMYTTGGRGGKVIYVTSLADTNTEGTLRWAINQSGARTILFKVSGIIKLNSQLSISNGNLTIAGQSAPGDGICIRDYPVQVKADNVIIRYMRFRMGDEKDQENDAFWGRERKNIIIDHCSMSWSTDECASFYDNENFTMQWCILAESLRNSIHGKGSHGYGAIWGGKKASFHHNLLTCHDSRNPRFCGSRYSNKPELELVDFRNNVLYNWGGNTSYAAEGGSYNIVNNYYKAGPASSSRSRIIQPYPDNGENKQPAGTYGHFYVNGNYVSASSAVTNDNWQGVNMHSSFSTYAPGVTKDDLKSATEFDMPKVKTHTAQEAFEKVLDYAGCSLTRDILDERYAREAKEGTTSTAGSNGSKNGLIDTQSDAGGWPEYNTTTTPSDSNNDGIPDGWLEENYPGKMATDKNSEGYTYLEVYLNSIVKHITEGQGNDDGGEGEETILFCGAVPTDNVIPQELKDLISAGNISTAGNRTDACTEEGYTWRTSDVAFNLPEKASFAANFTSNGTRYVHVIINGDEENATVYNIGSKTCEAVYFKLDKEGGNTLQIRSYGSDQVTLSQFSMIDLCIKNLSSGTSIENPAVSNKIRIIENTLYTTLGNIEIFSVSGRISKTVKNAEQIYIGDLPSGVYIIKLTDRESNVSIQKFIKR